jgi:hypothetical protein
MVQVPHLCAIFEVNQSKKGAEGGIGLACTFVSCGFPKDFYFYTLVITNLGLDQGSGSTTLTRRINRLGRLSVVVDPDPIGSKTFCRRENHSGSGFGQPGSGMSLKKNLFVIKFTISQQNAEFKKIFFLFPKSFKLRNP